MPVGGGYLTLILHKDYVELCIYRVLECKGIINISNLVKYAHIVPQEREATLDCMALSCADKILCNGTQVLKGQKKARLHPGAQLQEHYIISCILLPISSRTNINMESLSPFRPVDYTPQ